MFRLSGFYAVIPRISPPGTILVTNWVFTALDSFADFVPNGVAQGSDGNFYGTTWNILPECLGEYCAGTVYQANPAGAATYEWLFGRFSSFYGNTPEAEL